MKDTRCKDQIKTSQVISSEVKYTSKFVVSDKTFEVRKKGLLM